MIELKSPYWMKQESEDEIIYTYFMFYLMLGPDRNIGFFLRRNGDPHVYENQLLYDWSIKYQWDVRAYEFDEELASRMLLPGYETRYMEILKEWTNAIIEKLEKKNRDESNNDDIESI